MLQHQSKHQVWTTAQENMALRLMEERCPSKEFFKKIGRTKSAAQSHFYYIRHPYKTRDHDRINARRRRTYVGDYVCKLETDEMRISARPTEAMLADAAVRNNTPRSGTAWLNGDPAPGYSALDKRVKEFA